MEEQKDKKINIELSDEIAGGDYVNLSVITHSQSEFVLDFVNMMPGRQKAKVTNRVIMVPQNAKRLLRALMDNITKYEQKHGTIKEPEREPSMIMRGPKGEA